MKHYIKATKLLNDIIKYANEIESSIDLERESKLATLQTYYNDIAKMLYLDSINVLLLDEIEKHFKRFKKINK